MISRCVTRRQLFLLAATALGSTLFGRWGIAGPPDQGIGGTGFSVRPVEDDSDRGIGGTGVIGTIRKFGSIVVNDLRIAYPQDVTVRIDGQPASAADLKLGQVVRVVATSGARGGLSTRAIDVASEVVGPIERVTPKTLTVLGQTVSTAELKGVGPWHVGDHVAVSGLRRNDGTIAASLIERRGGDLLKVAGPISQARDGTLRIGGLPLSGLAGSLIGERAIVEGQAQGGRLAVTRSTGETALLPKDIRALSVEAYVERRGGDLHLGSGLLLEGGTAAIDLPLGRSVRAVLTTSVGADRQLRVEALRVGGRSYRAAPLSGVIKPGDSGGRRPMDFGPIPSEGARPPNDRPRDIGGPRGGPGGRCGPGGGVGGGGFGSGGGGRR